MKQIESRCCPIIENNITLGSLRVDIDVTDYKEIEEKLLHALSEKEVMLKEIHHRVKNNLQIIMSLINLQSYSSTDKIINDALLQTYERIRTIALVHEHLYKSHDVGIVCVEEYVPNLISKISNAFYREGLTVSTEFQIQDTELNIDRAIPLGLIINELAMNSFKYAFNKNSESILRVTFHHTASNCAELVVSDNGPGLPGSYDSHNESTLGLRLVGILVDQIKGTLQYSNENGAMFRIVLPLQ